MFRIYLTVGVFLLLHGPRAREHIVAPLCCLPRRSASEEAHDVPMLSGA